MPTYIHHEQLARPNLAAALDKYITICGAGALGANLTEMLARMGYKRLAVIDRDRIEEHNLSTQPWTRQEIGAPKARTLAQQIYRSVEARIAAQVVELTSENAVQLLQSAEHLIVDCFDNVAARRAVAEAAETLGRSVLHLALGGDGTYGAGFWGESYLLPPSTYQGYDGCDYPLSRVLVSFVVAAGAEVITRYLTTGEIHGFEFTLGDLKLTSWKV